MRFKGGMLGYGDPTSIARWNRRERSRSRGPRDATRRYYRSRRPVTVPVSEVEEDETIYVGYVNRMGTWRFPIHLTDFNTFTWEEVTPQMVVEAIKVQYEHVLGRELRLQIAVNGMVMRAHDTIGRWVEAEGDFRVCSAREGSPIPREDGIRRQRAQVQPPPDLVEPREEANHPSYVHGLFNLMDAFPDLRRDAAFCRFSPFLRKQSIWETQIFAENRRFSQKTADFRRKPQIGVCPLRFVPLSAALNLCCGSLHKRETWQAFYDME